MQKPPSSRLLTAAELPAAEIINPDGKGGIVLVCEHASRAIPAALGGLGISAGAATSHAAWDIGARDVAIAMSVGLDAPLVASRVSRLVYDCNRPPEAAGAMPEQSEVFTIPGNQGLTGADRAARVAEVYRPFEALLRTTLDAAAAPPLLITIHSFTPVYFGKPRATELGFLHDSDSRLADAILLVAAQSGIRAELNAPYAASDGVTHTLREHAVSRSLLNVMIEIRNDLIDTPETAAAMAATLCGIIREARRICGTKTD